MIGLSWVLRPIKSVKLNSEVSLQTTSEGKHQQWACIQSEPASQWNYLVTIKLRSDEKRPIFQLPSLPIHVKSSNYSICWNNNIHLRRLVIKHWVALPLVADCGYTTFHLAGTLSTTVRWLCSLPRCLSGNKAFVFGCQQQSPQWILFQYSIFHIKCYRWF